MKADRVLAAGDLLAWLSEKANLLPDDKANRVEMSLVLQMASLYLLEFAGHLLDDDEPFDALLKTACGEAPLPEGPALTVFRLMMAKPAGDD
jgi:hypothetical protein